MKTIRRISYRNVVYFREADLDLDKEGVTFVVGRNHNSPHDGKSNGAGKTLLVSGIPHLRHGSPVGSSSLYRHSLLADDESSIEWSMEDGEHAWIFRKERQGASIRWTVKRDGDLMQLRSARQAEEVVAGVFDFNDEEFYSTVYLDSRRPSAVLHGTAAARQSFVSDLFHLSGYGDIRAWFASRLKEAKAKADAAKELERAMKNMEDASDEDVAELGKQERLASKQVGNLSARLESLREDLNARTTLDKLGGLAKDSEMYDPRMQGKAMDALAGWEEYEKQSALKERSRKIGKDLSMLGKKLSAVLKGAGFSKFEELESSLAVARRTLEGMEKHLKEKSRTETCPLCLSDLPRKKAEALRDDAKDVLARNKDAYGKASALRKRIIETELDQGRIGQVPSKEDLDRLRPRMPKTEAASICEEQAKFKKARKAAKDMKKAGLYGKDDLPEADKLAADMKKTSKKLQEAKSRLDVARRNLSRAEAAVSLRKSARKRVSELDTGAKDAKLLDFLVECYGPKGLRVAAVRNTAKAIEDNLNDMSPYLCPEPMEFALDAGPNSMDVRVSRSDGRESDVRHLSGAESRMFQLLWTAAVLPLLPDGRRCNVAVLDEFESGLDVATRGLLMDEYLPKLSKLVPHVLFISPYDVDPDNGRRVLQVEKKGRRSWVTEA